MFFWKFNNFNALHNACYMFHRSIDSLLKAQYHQKRHKKKALNWLKLITKQVQVQVIKTFGIKLKSYEKKKQRKQKSMKQK